MRKNQRNSRFKGARRAKASAARKAKIGADRKARAAEAPTTGPAAMLGGGRTGVDNPWAGAFQPASSEKYFPTYIKRLPDSVDDEEWKRAMTLHKDDSPSGGMFNFGAGLTIFYEPGSGDFFGTPIKTDERSILRLVKEANSKLGVDSETSFRCFPFQHIKVRRGACYPKVPNDPPIYPGVFFTPADAMEALDVMREGGDEISIGRRSIEAVGEMAKAILQGKRDDVVLSEGHSFRVAKHEMGGTRVGGYVGDSVRTLAFAHGVLHQSGLLDEGFDFALETNDSSMGLRIPMQLRSEPATEALWKTNFDGHMFRGVLWRDDVVITAIAGRSIDIVSALASKVSSKVPKHCADALRGEASRLAELGAGDLADLPFEYTPACILEQIPSFENSL